MRASFAIWTGLVALSLTTSLAAQTWNMRDADKGFDAAALTARLSGQTLVYFDEGQSVYEEDGQYQYIYGDGGIWYGHWTVTDNSVVCVTFVTGVTRCDRIVQNGDRLVVQTADGMRFPVRDINS